MDLEKTLPILLPKAVGWAEEQQRDILAFGRTLTADEIAAARAVGVSQPEMIRVKSVSSIPVPRSFARPGRDSSWPSRASHRRSHASLRNFYTRGNIQPDSSRT